MRINFRRTAGLFFFILPGFFLGLTAQQDPSSGIPRRIVSLAPFVTEDLYLLGADDRLVACTTFCNRPVAAQKKPRVSTAVKPNIEKILSLEPDLVLSSELIDPRSISQLRQLGIRVKTFPVAKNFSEICRIFMDIAVLAGEESAGRSVIKNAEARVRLIQDSIGKSPGSPVRVFMQIGMKPLFTVIRDTFLHDYIQLAGGMNIAEDLSSGMISREVVLRRDPDIILIVSMGEYHDSEKTLWMSHRRMTAVKHRHVFVLDAEKVCSPTPATFCDSLEEIAGLIQKVRFPKK